MIDKILDKVGSNISLSHSDAVRLLKEQTNVYDIFKMAYNLSKTEYQNKGYVFAQIGINSNKCSGGCEFCSLNANNFLSDCESQTSDIEIQNKAKELATQGISDLFLMTTADYSKDKFLNICKTVKNDIGNINLVANVGDFDIDYARELKAVGAKGAYHILRLREGIDTAIDKKTRLKSIDAIISGGLELYYCIEPIGKEHTYEEIADEMIRARDFGVNVMAVMKRIAIKGSKLYEKGEISTLELLKIAAVTRLVTRPKKSMNVHEVTEGSLLVGVNQLYAEVGVNPRDTEIKTESSRGYSVKRARELLNNYGYEI